MYLRRVLIANRIATTSLVLPLVYLSDGFVEAALLATVLLFLSSVAVAGVSVLIVGWALLLAAGYDIGWSQLGILIAALVVADAYRRELGKLPAGLPEGLRALLRALLLMTAMCFGIALLFRGSNLLWCGAWLLMMLCLRRAIPAAPESQRPTWKSVAINAATLGISLGLAILFTEAAVRVTFGHLFRPISALQPHPDRLFSTTPNAVDTFVVAGPGGVPERVVRFEISPQGFRGREIYGEKRPDEYRVLMLGDSFVIGYGLTWEETIAQQLRARLQSRLGDRPVTVVNAGVQGYGPWQELSLFVKEGLPLKPDLVVLALFPTNDLEDMATGEGIFLRSFNPTWRKSLLQQELRSWREKVEAWVQKHWQTYAVFSRNFGFPPPGALSGLLYQIRFIGDTPPDLSVPRPLERPRWLEPNLCDWYPELDHVFEKTSDTLRSFQEICEREGIAFCAFVIPSARTMEDERWVETLASAPSDVCYDRHKPVQVFEERLRLLHIPYVSLYERLLNRKLYFEVDGHFNPEGASEVADVLEDFIFRSFLSGEATGEVSSGASNGGQSQP